MNHLFSWAYVFKNLSKTNNLNPIILICFLNINISNIYFTLQEIYIKWIYMRRKSWFVVWHRSLLKHMKFQITNIRFVLYLSKLHLIMLRYGSSWFHMTWRIQLSDSRVKVILSEEIKFMHLWKFKHFVCLCCMHNSLILVS